MFKWIYRMTVTAAVILLLVDVAVAAMDPQLLIKDTANSVLLEITLHEQEIRADRRLVYALVEAKVVPHFDFNRMSQSAMGRFWRKATDVQKRRIVDEFQRLLIRTYAVALLDYSGQVIEYQPIRTDKRSGRVMVPTRIKSSKGPSIPIDYRLYLKNDQWKIYDVVIDGVSLITNYRSSFANQIRRRGIDGLITRLAEQNKRTNG